LRTDHTLYRLNPLPWLHAVPFSALVAAQRPAGTGEIWTGDGGSVMLGHTYLSRRSVDRAASVPAAERASARIDGIRSSYGSLVGEAALASAEAALAEEYADADNIAPERRHFHHLMRGDQARHADRYYEHIDLFGAEPVMPLFDRDLAELVYSAPMEHFLDHKIYADVLKSISPAAAAVPWQAYPGHRQPFTSMPANLVTQWQFDFDRSAKVRNDWRTAVRSLRDCETSLKSSKLRRLSALLATPLWKRAWAAERLTKLAREMQLLPLPSDAATLPPDTKTTKVAPKVDR
ncbi:MAG: hypothetical protein WA906_10320, partial [Pacificimonas sp.]